MSSRTRAAQRRATSSGEPTRKKVVLYYAMGGLLMLALALVARLLDWSRTGLLLGGIVLVIVYVPAGLTFLFGRSEPSSRT